MKFFKKDKERYEIARYAYPKGNSQVAYDSKILNLYADVEHFVEEYNEQHKTYLLCTLTQDETHQIIYIEEEIAHSYRDIVKFADKLLSFMERTHQICELCGENLSDRDSMGG